MYYVWVWGNSGKKILFYGPQSKCREYKRDYHGYRKEDIYISKK